MSFPVLVTGASGFVGSAVVRQLAGQGWPVRAALRRAVAGLAWLPSPGVQPVQVGDLAADTDWRGALHGVQGVVHCAARVHVLRETSCDPLAEFRRVNVQGTLALARQAVQAGVRRFVFISSIGVNGAQTLTRPFRADDVPAPHSPYAVAKHEAEQALQALAADSGLDLVVIRPPLVYGPGAPGNFARLVGAVQRGLPLPLGAVHNRRSLVALPNLADLVQTCLAHPAAAGQTFLVSDGEDISTTALLRAVGQALGRPARLLPVPASLLTGTARLLGRPQLAQQLCGSLQVDIDKTRSLLGWAPVVSVAQALRQTVAPAASARLA
jgi:nucleoside-diphosphate-sugar epimerase